MRKAAGQDLRGRVAVAEVPGDAGQGQGVGGRNVEDGFGGGADQDQAAVVEGEEVAVAQDLGFREVEQEGSPASVVRRRRRRWRSS